MTDSAPAEHTPVLQDHLALRDQMAMRDPVALREVVVLGAGLAGLSAAYHLGGFSPVYESSEIIGGLAASRRQNGFTFDYTGHLLHFRVPSIRDLVASLLGPALRFYRRNSAIHIGGLEVKYPFQANLHDLPEPMRRECLEGFLAVSGQRRRSVNFEEWIRHRFGKGIARHFMIPYNAKLWRYPLEQMSCSWIDSLIPQPDVEEVIRGAEGPPQREFGYNIEFAYPLGGIGELARAFAHHIERVQTRARAVAIDPQRREVRFADGQRVGYRSLISTMPLPNLVRLLDPCPPELATLAKRLVWNSIINVNLGVAGPARTNRHWIYFPEPDYIFYRVGCPSNFAVDVAPPGDHAMYVEVSYRDACPDQAQLLQRVLADLRRVGLLTPEQVVRVCEVNDLRFAYVIYDLDYGESTRALHAQLRALDIHSIGRFGRWRYYSMEQAMLDGRQCAEEIAAQLAPNTRSTTCPIPASSVSANSAG
jgi:protoporphyrinogen oxidase